jgi:large-conductance mechanosensitive channel
MMTSNTSHFILIAFFLYLLLNSCAREEETYRLEENENKENTLSEDLAYYW